MSTPLHPMLVHFPIAFYFLELLLLFFWAAQKQESYQQFALFTFKAGYLLMLAAIVAGLRDAGGFGRITGRVRPHFFWALAVFGIYTLRAFLWKVKGSDRNLQLWGALFGCIALAVAAYFGGEIVFRS